MNTSYHPPAPSLQTWTTIFLCTNPPSLPMMLSKSSKLIRPSESLSAYWKVLLTRIKDAGIAMQCLACSRINDNRMATKIILMPLSITCWQSSAAAHLSDSCPPSSAAPELGMKKKSLGKLLQYQFDHRRKILPGDETIAVNVIYLESKPGTKKSLSRRECDRSVFKVFPSVFQIHQNGFRIYQNIFQIYQNNFQIHQNGFRIMSKCFPDL